MCQENIFFTKYFPSADSRNVQKPRFYCVSPLVTGGTSLKISPAALKIPQKLQVYSKTSSLLFQISARQADPTMRFRTWNSCSLRHIHWKKWNSSQKLEKNRNGKRTPVAFTRTKNYWNRLRISEMRADSNFDFCPRFSMDFSYKKFVQNTMEIWSEHSKMWGFWGFFRLDRFLWILNRF